MILDIIRKHNETGVKMTPAFRKFIRAGIDAGNIWIEEDLEEVSGKLPETSLVNVVEHVVNLSGARATYNKSKTRLWGDPRTMADMVEDFGRHQEEEAELERLKSVWMERMLAA